MTFWEWLFPTNAERRRLESEELKLREQYLRVAQREVAQLEAHVDRPSFLPNSSRSPINGSTVTGPLSESQQFLGSPWQSELAGLTLDQAWRMGFPDQSLAFQYDAKYIASSDSFRLEMLRVCRVLYDSHPHAKAIINAQVNFIVGPNAWTVEPAPKLPDETTFITSVAEADDSIKPVGDDIAPVIGGTGKKNSKPLDDKPEPDLALQRKLKRLWAKFQRRGKFHPQLGWVQFWREAFLRSRRDGEVFIFLGNTKDDGRLAPRFLEPENIVSPNGVSGSSVSAGSYTSTMPFDQDACGIRVDENDPSTVIGYWHRRNDKLGDKPQLIDADKVLHIKFGVDSATRRGIPALFVCRHFLRHFDTWIQQSLKHQKIQSSIAILRKWNNSTQDAVSSFVASRDFQKRDITSPAGSTITARTQQLFPVVDAPAGMDLSGFTPNGNFGDSEVLARRVLLACAAGEDLSEAMVSADGSNANYASTRITQIIPFRGFAAEQGVWAEYIQYFYERWGYTEAAMGRIPVIRDEDQLDCNVTPSKIPNFEGELTADPAVKLQQAQIISRRTAQEMVGLDADVEEDRLDEEQHQLDEEPNPLQAIMQEPEQEQDKIQSKDEIKPVEAPGTDGEANED